MEEENKNVEQPVVDTSIPTEPVQTPVTEAPVESAPAPVDPVAQPEVAPAPVAEPAVAPAATEEPKKKGKGGLIFLLLLLLVGGGFAGWYFALGGKDVLAGKKEEPKQEEKKEEKKEEEKKEEEKKEETSKVKKVSEKAIENFVDLIDRIIYIRGTKTTFTSTDLTNQDILYFGVLNGQLRAKEEFTVSELDEIIKKSGLGDIEYKNETINCFCQKALFDYSEEQNKYVKSEKQHAHGGESSLSNKKFFVDAELNEETGILTVNYKIIYGEIQGDLRHPNFNLYLNAQDASDQKNGIFTEEKEDGYGTEEDYKKAYDEFGDKTPVTTFYFKKGNTGNYSFVKVETK